MNKNRWIDLMLLGTLLGTLCYAAWITAEGQDIAGHETVRYTIATTYIGPMDAIVYDTKWIVDNLHAFPEIYCEGDFEFSHIEEDVDILVVVCVYDWTPDGTAGH